MWHVWQSLDVVFTRTTNKSNSIVLNLDTSFSIVSYDITLDIRLAMLAIDDDTILSTLLNLVPPYEWLSECFVVKSKNFHAEIMRLRDLIIKKS